MGRRRLLLLSLVVFAVGCRADKRRAGGGEPQDPPPELSMRGLSVQSYGPGGLEWEMKAPIGEAFTHKNIMQVSSMTVQLFENGERSTEIAAPRAVMATGDRGDKTKVVVEPKPGVPLVAGDMFLDGGVVVVSTEGSHLTTEWVKYHVNDQIIKSSAPVVVRRPDSITKGVGLEATSDLSRLRIFNQTLVIPGDPEEKQ